MPLISTEHINKNIKLAIWEIQEDEDTLSQMVDLSEKDKATLQTIRNETKRLEFYAGRTLCQQAFSTFELAFHGMFRDDNGKPCLEKSSIHISLSHTERYVTLLIGLNFPVGIDIEKPKEKMMRLAPKFLREKELEQCADNLHKISIGWSAKEVLYKIYAKKKLIFNKHLLLEPISDDWTKLIGTIENEDVKKTYALQVKPLGEYYICFNTAELENSN